MPESPPFAKLRRPSLTPVAPPASPTLAYAELHCRTNFSFLEGASHPDELVQTAAAHGYRALAITDRNSLAGVVRAHVAAREVGLKLLIGAEITPEDAPPVVLLATNREAYGRLCRLITTGRLRAPKGECRLTFDDIAAHAEGLLACVLLNACIDGDTRYGMRDAGCGGGRVRSEADGPASARPGLPVRQTRPPNADRRFRIEDRVREPTGIHLPSSILHPSSSIQYPLSAIQHLARYRELFGDRCYGLAERHLGPRDDVLLHRLGELARHSGLPLATGNDVHYHTSRRRFLQDVLSAVRHRCTVAELGQRRFSNGERYLKSPAAMRELFAVCPDAVARTAEIADRCTFSLDELRYDYPEELCPEGMTKIDYLRKLTFAGAAERYPGGVPDKVRQIIEHELRLIEKLRYESYFLTVWDLVKYARSREILCQGRGSAANSAVCFCLGVTSVDPDQIDVLFERFVSEERNEAPDIDVDFEHERREEVLQYVYDKYGRDRSGMTATVITYRPKSAIRDVGKALGLSLDRIDLLAGSLGHPSEHDQFVARMREAGLDPQSRIGRQLIVLVREILGFPRHLSQHVGGMVITQRPLCELAPIENAAMEGRTIIPWDKDDLDALGILKVDCLSLGMLTCLQKSFDLLEQHYQRRITLATVPQEDPGVYEMIRAADTIGVFQIESRAQMSSLPLLKPQTWYDLVIQIAIIRPGPIQGDMVHPYRRRKNGEEPVEYPDERIREVLHKTLGVPLFQEQAMRLAIVAAGFTPGEADQLRRAMAAWRRTGNMEQFRTKLITGMQANGYDAEFGERLYRMIQGFGQYGFPESHAASFARLAYASAWLKHHYPEVFTTALLNSQPMGFYQPSQLVRDARDHGVEVRPVDVNFSEWDCTLERGGRDVGCGGGGRVRSEADGPASAHPGLPVGQTRPPDKIRDARCGARDAGRIPCATAVSAVRDTSDLPHVGTADTAVAHPSANQPPALRLGFRMVKGMSEGQAVTIMRCRGERPFTSFDDFARRTRFSNALLARLSNADAFGSLSLSRRAAAWQSLPDRSPSPLFDGVEEAEPPVALPAMSPLSEVAADYTTTGLSLRNHPVSFLRETLTKRGVTAAEGLATYPADRWVTVAGLVMIRQRPGTAKGVTFVTLEDETGVINLIIWQNVWDQHRRIASGATVLLASGPLQRQDPVIHVVVHHMENVSEMLQQVAVKSRDFH